MAHRRDPAPQSHDLRQDWRAIRTLAPYLWPPGATRLRVRVIVALILLAAAKLTNVLVPILYKSAVDTLSPKTATVIAVPIALLLGYGLARVATQAFGELRDAVFAKVAQRAVRQAGLETFQHLHRLSLRFHLDRKTGGVSRAIERGVRGIEFLLNFMLFNILPTMLEILLVCGILWAMFDVWFALVTFVTIVGYVAWTLTVTEWRIKYRRRMNETDSEAHSKAVDSLLNYETVKYFGNEAHEARRFDSALRDYETAAVKSVATLSLLNIGQGAIIAAGLVGVMTLAGYGVAAGTMTIGDFVLVNTYLIQLYMPLNFLGFVYREIKRSLADMEEMFGLGREAPEIRDRDDAPPLRANGGEVAFDNVSFAYDERRPVLDGVSFTVPSGKTVAIVGPSGAGKSTISRLLFRFYDPTGGRIVIDGQDIRDVTQHSLRAAIGIVPQDTVLFNDTIYYNIAYGRPDATPAEVEHAARLARVHDFVIAQPDGYQAMVGERGLKPFGRRETACRHRADHPEGPAHPDLRRGDQRTRHPHRARNPGIAGRGLGRPHHGGHRASALDRDRRRRDHRPGGGPHRRTRRPRGAFAHAGPLRRHVETVSRKPRRPARHWKTPPPKESSRANVD